MAPNSRCLIITKLYHLVSILSQSLPSQRHLLSMMEASDIHRTASVYSQSKSLNGFSYLFSSFFSRRCSEIITIQNELYKYKAELRNSQLESENDKKRIEELEEENLQLQMTSKLSISESQVLTLIEYLSMD